MNTSSSVNPFQSPQSVEKPPPSKVIHLWKDLAWRWERLRVLFNVVVGLAGVIALFVLPPSDSSLFRTGLGIIRWGVAANFCYLLGPIVQMYLCWFAEFRGDDGESAAEQLASSRGMTWLMFVTGTGFSVLVTCLGAFELT